jgi:hypothetical protein
MNWWMANLLWMTNLLQEKKEKRANPGNERWLFLHPVA